MLVAKVELDDGVPEHVAPVHSNGLIDDSLDAFDGGGGEVAVGLDSFFDVALGAGGQQEKAEHKQGKG